MKKNTLFLNAIERNTLLVFLAWSGILGFSVWHSIKSEKEHLHKIATNEIRSNFEDVETFRHWIASRGGVYVPISDSVRPNPALDHMQERDISTSSGKQLTLVNTPYILRQLSDSEESSFSAHMTSLNPINPENKADNWERGALLAILEGKKEVCDVVEYKGAQHMRLMRPARFEPECGECHYDKEYIHGDILGGLTVSVPMQAYNEQTNAIIQKLKSTHALLWFLGTLGIGIVYRNEKKHSMKREETENELRRSSVAFNNIEEGLVITDNEMNIIAVNKAFTKLTSYSADLLLNYNISKLEKNISFKRKQFRLTDFLNQKESDSWEIEFKDKKDRTISLLFSMNTVSHDGVAPSNYVLVFSDIRERKQFEKTLEHLAQHDHLTNLPNRLLLNDRLEQAIIRAEREQRKIAILFLDLDHFKNINDSLGHNIGDSVLIQIAQRLKKNVRKGDTLARLGGDEFIIIMEHIQTDEDAETLAKKLVTCIKPALTLKEQNYYLGVSIGISIYPDHGSKANDLISKADIAMYQAKANGRNNFKFYSPKIDNDFRDRLKLETDLRRAIENDEFILEYQPQVSINDNNIIGVECLVRWQHPELGLIYPNDFIHTAESLNLMIPIGDLVIDKACAQMKKWKDTNVNVDIMAINFSGKQITDIKLAEKINAALEKYNLPIDCIELEVTENYLMTQSEESIHVLEQLRNSSLHISIDDFGTGYSSLNYLKKLPINKIKLDRSFVAGIPDDVHDVAIIKAVIAIGKSLGYQVIAEGVETEEQLDFLRQHGCHQYQGYYCSKPLPAVGFESIAKKNRV